jgi:hypothetical protein
LARGLEADVHDRFGLMGGVYVLEFFRYSIGVRAAVLGYERTSVERKEDEECPRLKSV